jgi:predicted MPP superfamily phosphohydrolase
VRVVHLTDLHVGRITPMRVQWAAVELANRQRPDLVAITGDFVAHTQLYLDELGAVVSRFEAPVVCVLGNHDHWAGAREVRWALGRAGAEVLDNYHTVVTLRGQRLALVGVDDAYTGHASWQRAVRGLRADLPSLGLSHIAEEADALWRAGVSLVLAGHTHAGMVSVARLHELAIGRFAGYRYVHGLYGTRRRRPGTGAVYVAAGVGAAVLPVRMGERSRREIAVFELGTPPGTFREPHAEQQPRPGREPSARRQYRRAAAVVKREQRRARRAACRAHDG